ncbi:MAG: nucleotidyltransferase domain-containing protein [Deltaproteobacteria bacterium]|nr:nucleotidyltransferase domain-containing protein [Deltaproteobacteria bacterium]
MRPRVSGIYLYGSQARGDYHADSDVDLLILLKGEIKAGDEINRFCELVSDLCLRYNLLSAILPVPEEWLKTRKSPFFENIHGEGVIP